ncbi:unnamed protein product [Diplocarpon coronariae]
MSIHLSIRTENQLGNNYRVTSTPSAKSHLPHPAPQRQKIASPENHNARM